MNKKIIGNIYQTMNYDQFEIIAGNRKVNHSKKISQSIEKHGLLLSPIIVNEYMQIIDGQNRFEAAKSKGLPINYIIAEGYGISQVRALNEYAKNWNILDYIRSYATNGVEGCQQLLEFLNKYNSINRSALIELALANCLVYASTTEQLEKFTFENREFAEKVADALVKIGKLEISDTPVSRRREFCRAMAQVIKVDGFDMSVMISKIKLQPRKLVPCGNAALYIDMLEDIYNFRNKAPLHFDF